jgi:hypothetical protein
MQYHAGSLNRDIDANAPGSRPHYDLVTNSFRPQRTPARSHAEIDLSHRGALAYKVTGSPTSSQLTSSAWSPAESATQASFPIPFSGLWTSKYVTGDPRSKSGRNLWPVKIDNMLNASDSISDDDWYDPHRVKTIARLT